MSISRATRACAYSELSGHERFCSCSECCGFFIADVNPFNAGPTDGIHNWVEAVANQPKDSFYALFFEILNELFCEILSHVPLHYALH